ncbi:hypothetical protein F2Q69_00028078, partial [Brassica cretica]
MILCTAINHCLCDGIGTSQFLHAWAQANTTSAPLPIQPFHSRHMLEPRDPPHVTHSHPSFTWTTVNKTSTFNICKYLQSQPLAPTTLTFTPSLIIRLKKTCAPSLECTTFEALAAHTWCSWTRSLDLPLTMQVKLLFSVNMRKKLTPELPQGYYGNGFVLACAERKVQHLVNGNIYHVVKLIQDAKARITDEYVRSTIDLLEDKTVKTDVSKSLVISQWARLGLEDLDFGGGKPMYMGSLTSDIYCLFLPVTGNCDAISVQVCLPEDVLRRLEYYMVKFLDEKGYTSSAPVQHDKHPTFVTTSVTCSAVTTQAADSDALNIEFIDIKVISTAQTDTTLTEVMRRYQEETLKKKKKKLKYSYRTRGCQTEGIGVPHGVLGDIWVCLELERGVKMIIGRAERWERLPVATPASRSDLPYQSDLTRAMRRSRSLFHPGGSRKLTRSDLSERPLQVAPEAQSDLVRVTPRGRSHFYRVTTTQWSWSDLSERPTEVAPEAWSDLTRATQRSRSRFHRSETRKRARSDVSQRPLQ